MKKLLTLLAFTGLLASCETRPYVSSTETRYSANGDSSVFVHYIDDNGHSQDFFMEYVLYNSLFSHGGYNNVYGYYHSHPSYFSIDRQRHYYHYTPSVTVNNHYYGPRNDYSSHPRISSSTSRSSWFRSSPSSSRSSYSSSPARSGYTPSRSSWSSSPSRSSSYSSSRSSYRSSPARSSGRH